MNRLRKALATSLGTATVVVAAIAGGFAGGGGAMAQSGVCPANPSPPDAADPAIEVHSPAEGSTVTSPIQIDGLARVFEATVSIELYNEDGNVVAENFTTADAGAPEKAPYSTSVEFTVGTTQRGCLRVFEASAMDGSPTNVVQVEVVLQGTGTAPTPHPPATGTGTGPSDRAGVQTGLFVLSFATVLAIGAAALRRRRQE